MMLHKNILIFFVVLRRLFMYTYYYYNVCVMKYIFILTANWPKSILLVLIVIIEDGFQ